MRTCGKFSTFSGLGNNQGQTLHYGIGKNDRSAGTKNTKNGNETRIVVE